MFLYSREFLLDVGKNHIFRVKLHAHRRAAGPRSAPKAYTITDPHYCISPTAEALQAAWEEAEEGKRGGIRARLAANPHKPSIPTIVLANVHSLDNKLDYIRLLRSTQRTVRDCYVFVFTETWLNNSVPDCAIQLD